MFSFFTWRQSEEVSFLTDRWRSKIEEILGSYGLLPEYINSMKSAIIAKQKQLLAQSQVEKDYLNSLIELKNQIKKKLEDLVREYRPRRSEQAPRVARNAQEEYGFHMRHSYKQVSVADRLEELRKINSYISDSIHDAHIIEIVERVELLEDLTAASAKNKTDYTARMAEVREAVQDRVSQILENAV
ncbi:hypothetical protein OESDEN_19218 [Oesophagostomum dentatum]|uniref:Uncharacterized protein n=1 Tax=Oesophagostomum dentatum TaxID=61180 RepID=A0A0B1SB44_OESDE|nr:hypothetical protein OESDEN_19218 [Oesophagostomum dentatum]